MAPFSCVNFVNVLYNIVAKHLAGQCKTIMSLMHITLKCFRLWLQYLNSSYVLPQYNFHLFILLFFIYAVEIYPGITLGIMFMRGFIHTGSEVNLSAFIYRAVL